MDRLVGHGNVVIAVRCFLYLAHSFGRSRRRQNAGRQRGHRPACQRPPQKVSTTLLESRRQFRFRSRLFRDYSALPCRFSFHVATLRAWRPDGPGVANCIPSSSPLRAVVATTDRDECLVWPFASKIRGACPLIGPTSPGVEQKKGVRDYPLGTTENNVLSPSAIVGCVKTMSRSVVYGKPARPSRSERSP